MKVKSTSPRRRYCIIGAGFSGLGVAKAFRDAGIPYDQIEREPFVGGNWANGVFESTHIISSRKSTEYLDYPMPADWPDFPSSAQMNEYLESFAEEFGLKRSIEFETEVQKVEPLDETGMGGWRVVVSGGEVRHYAGVIIANGHHWHKRYPSYPGEFAGKQLHSREYRNVGDIEGERVLVVGAGNSACDIAVETGDEFGKSYISMRRGNWFLPKTFLGIPVSEIGDRIDRPWVPDRMVQRRLVKLITRLSMGPNSRYGLDEPDYEVFDKHPIINSQMLYKVRHGNVEVKPDISRFAGNTVHFVDGSSIEADTVVYATGYDVAFPMLDDSLLRWEDGVPLRVGSALPPDRANLYLFGVLQPRGGAGPIITEGAKTIARIVQTQEELDHPIVEDLARLQAPDSRMLVSPMATIRQTRQARKALRAVLAYNRARGRTVGLPPEVPPPPKREPENETPAQNDEKAQTPKREVAT